MRGQRNQVNAVSDEEDLEGQLVRVQKKTRQQGRLLKHWNKIFVVSCGIAVSVDPLFFYIPVINEDDKCVGFDRNAEIIAICLRSVTDLFYIVNIILRYYMQKSSQKLGRTNKLVDFYSVNKLVSSRKLGTDASEIVYPSKQVSFEKFERTKSLIDASEIASRYLWGYFLVDVLSTLPIPQVVITNTFFKLEGSNYFNTRTWLNLAVFLQYVPRVVRMFLSWMELIKTGSKFARSLKVKAAFNLFLYILGSHVLGAFWYFLSIERETACWITACKNQTGCVRNSLDCKKSTGNYTFLSDLCPVKTENKTIFDFGIFLQAIQSGMLESTDFTKKLLYCFWWGLKNVSSSGQNLETSTDIWESMFAVFISIYGLILFLYFVGNLQVYLTRKATQSINPEPEADPDPDPDTSKRKEEKMRVKNLEIGEWVFRNKFPHDIKQKILEENKGVAENHLPLLPPKLRKRITLHLCLPLLNKVPMLQKEDKNWCHLICKYLKPVYYNENSYIVRAGEPLDKMLLITYGTVFSYTTSNGSTKPDHLKKGHIFGEELLDWGFKASTLNLSDIPISTKTVKTHTKVEAFALTAKHLKDLVVYKNEKALVIIQRAWRNKCGHCHHCRHYRHQPAQPQSITLANDGWR